MKSGSATPTSVRSENSGVTHTGLVISNGTAAALKRPWKIAIATPSTRITGTFERGQKFLPSRYAPNIGRISPGLVGVAMNASSANFESTPANNADASGSGSRFMIFSNPPEKPARMIITAQTMKAPVACGKVRCPSFAALAITAAPGVDHAIKIGNR